MKRTAVLIYPGFCHFEISPALELLALANKPITVFSTKREGVKSEEGLIVIPEKSLDELEIWDYDSLILPGAVNIQETIQDEAVLTFLRRFDRKDMVIGAISIAPVLLLKAGMLQNKPFMAGINREELLEEGFLAEELAQMKDWKSNLLSPVPEGFLVSENIITSVSYEFVRWALAFGRMLGIQCSPKTFGIRDEK